MNFNKLVVLFMLAGCGIDVRHSGQGEVIHKLDISEIEKYFEDACRDENPLFTEDQIVGCTADYVADFLESVAANE